MFYLYYEPKIWQLYAIIVRGSRFIINYKVAVFTTYQSNAIFKIAIATDLELFYNKSDLSDIFQFLKKLVTLSYI
jgi:hypothetical protein